MEVEGRRDWFCLTLRKCYERLSGSEARSFLVSPAVFHSLPPSPPRRGTSTSLSSSNLLLSFLLPSLPLFPLFPLSLSQGKLPAKQAFWLHTNFGYYAKFLIPVHAGAATAHYARGHAIFARINPFR